MTSGGRVTFSSKEIGGHLAHTCITESNETSVGVWKKVKKSIKPGGHLAAVSDIEAHYKTAASIEDAGFEIRDTIVFLCQSDSFDRFETSYRAVTLARKPLAEDNTAQNTLKHGTSAINIGECRIEYSGPVKRSSRKSDGSGSNEDTFWPEGARTANRPATPTEEGRWPTNLLLDYETCPKLDYQSGVLSSGEDAIRTQNASDSYHGGNTGAFSEGAVMTTYGDSGGASRYFNTPKDFNEEFENSESTGLMCFLIRLLTPKEGLVFDPFLSTGSVGVAAVLEEKVFVGKGNSHTDIEYAAQNASHLKEKYMSKEKEKKESDSEDTIKHNFWKK